MLRFVIKIGDDRFLVWSTISDAPVTRGMSKQQMIDYLVDDVCHSVDEDLALENAKRRVCRADRTGTSLKNDDRSVDNVISFNRAGPRQTRLSVQSLIKEYWE